MTRRVLRGGLLLFLYPLLVVFYPWAWAFEWFMCLLEDSDERPCSFWRSWWDVILHPYS